MEKKVDEDGGGDGREGDDLEDWVGKEKKGGWKRRKGKMERKVKEESDWRRMEWKIRKKEEGVKEEEKEIREEWEEGRGVSGEEMKEEE